MNDTALRIAMAEAKGAVERAGDGSLEDRLRAAMKATYRHWMATDEDVQFRAAVGGVLLATDDEAEKERLTAEVHQLRLLSATLSGLPIDPEAITPLEEPIGIMRLWHEVTGAT